MRGRFWRGPFVNIHFDARPCGVALSLPSADFGDEAVGVVDPAVKVAVQDTDLDFDHAEPAGVLGGVVELQAPHDWRASAGAKAW